MVAKSDEPVDLKKKKAVALRYDKGQDAAPKVAAKGAGRMAERILEIAEEHELHIHKDADLVEVLEKVELEQEIPLEVYSVVAEIFRYIYEANKKRGEAAANPNR